jgi:hypothetical protein
MAIIWQHRPTFLSPLENSGTDVYKCQSPLSVRISLMVILLGSMLLWAVAAAVLYEILDFL